MTARTGAALAGAIVALVCCSVLLSALAFTAREDHVLGIHARDAQQAFTSAERAAWTAFATLAPADTAMLPGETKGVTVDPDPVDQAGASVTRLNSAVYFAVGEAAVRSHRGAPLWKRVGILARVQRDSLGGVSFAPLPDRAWAELP